MNFGGITSLLSVRPVVVLTGFLGAGKTTLLKSLLKSCQNEDLRADVILNDFSDAELDSATMEGLAKSIEPLSAGCACCEGLDFLLELSLKTDQGDSDILFVELNGTADPVPIIETFTLLEERLKLHPRWQVCVIDTRHFGNRGNFSDIEELQLQTASHIYFSHIDDGESVDELLEQIRKVNAFATVLTKEELAESVTELGRVKKQRFHSSTKGQDEIELSTIKKSAQHQQTHEFNSCKILLPERAKESVINEWLRALPESVIRAKLLMGVEERPDGRYLFERVGMEVSRFPQRVDLAAGVENSAILIGPDLSPVELEQSAIKFLGKRVSSF